VGKDTINVTLDRHLWDGLSEFAHEQSLKGQRFPTIKALRIAVNVFLKLEVREINRVLKRGTRDAG
jgi:hypothetical protein